MLVIGLSSQSLWTPEISLRGGKQQTWQPLSPHQAVAGCDAYPRDHRMLSMRGNKLIKAIIAQMVCALFLLWSCHWQSTAVGGKYEENGERQKKEDKSQELWGRDRKFTSIQAQIVLIMSHQPQNVCVFVCPYKDACVILNDHECVDEILGLFFPGHSAVCWPKEPSHNQGVKC